MIFALNRSTAISFGVLLVLILICALVLTGASGSVAEIWARRGIVILMVNLIIGALCVPAIFAVVHAAAFAKLWWFPRLDGEWEAVLRSNWPRIRTTYEAARTKSARFDAMIDTLPAAVEDEGIVRAKVTIKSSLLLMSMKLEPVGSGRVSRTRFVRPQWLKPNLPELAYVFEQIDPGSIAPTDSRRHFGAGVVTYDQDTDVISGDYWTQRRDDVGFNTAGTITMTRRA